MLIPDRRPNNAPVSTVLTSYGCFMLLRATAVNLHIYNLLGIIDYCYCSFVRLKNAEKIFCGNAATSSFLVKNNSRNPISSNYYVGSVRVQIIGQPTPIKANIRSCFLGRGAKPNVKNVCQ